MKKIVSILWVLISVLFLCGFNIEKETVILGKTMGTTYTIKVIPGSFQRTSGLKEAIEKRLNTINQSMSTYIKGSEISRFNATRNTETKFFISDDFWNVMTVAAKLYRLTGGAWDATVKPLVNLWGFGSAKSGNRIPKKDKIDSVLSDIGFEKIEIARNRTLKKKKAAVSLDFGSIAKGYAVDQVANFIRAEGFENYLVEIGGEVYASGRRKDGKPWRVGINKPVAGAPADQVYKIVDLTDRALATSGDYRNYFIKNGTRYSHILDPRTGYPVKNGVVSASVTADTCTFADGLATALMVMGPEKGISLVNGINSVECLMVFQKQDGALLNYASKGFHAAE